jgi:hypothetical protein
MSMSAKRRPPGAWASPVTGPTTFPATAILPVWPASWFTPNCRVELPAIAV